MLKTTHITDEYELLINKAWEEKNYDVDKLKVIVNKVLGLLDAGHIRVAEKINGSWKVNEWIKRTILLSFKVNPMNLIKGTPGNASWFDLVDAKFHGWNETDFNNAKIRAVPGCFVRYSAYIGKKVILMPSFINIGAYIGDGTTIDTYASIGSCAQIGNNCHISQGAGIAGVLEPMQSAPVIIENNCFIGSNAQIAEGIIVEEGSVISMGVHITASTKIINRETGDVTYGKVPRNSVVVAGSVPTKDGKLSLNCAVIVKKTDDKTSEKTSNNDLLRK